MVSDWLWSVRSCGATGEFVWATAWRGDEDASRTRASLMATAEIGDRNKALFIKDPMASKEGTATERNWSALSPQGCLECVLQRELQEASVGRVLLEELRPGDLSTVRVVVSGGRIGECRVVQDIECIRTELQILLAEGGEVFEE